MFNVIQQFDTFISEIKWLCKYRYDQQAQWESWFPIASTSHNTRNWIVNKDCYDINCTHSQINIPKHKVDEQLNCWRV